MGWLDSDGRFWWLSVERENVGLVFEARKPLEAESMGVVLSGKSIFAPWRGKRTRVLFGFGFAAEL